MACLFPSSFLCGERPSALEKRQAAPLSLSLSPRCNSFEGGTSAVAVVGLLFAAAALVYYTSLPPIDCGAKRSGRDIRIRIPAAASAHLLPPLTTHTLPPFFSSDAAVAT